MCELRHEVGVEESAEFSKAEHLRSTLIFELDSYFHVVYALAAVLIERIARRETSVFDALEKLDAFVDRMPRVGFGTEQIGRMKKALC